MVIRVYILLLLVISCTRGLGQITLSAASYPAILTGIDSLRVTTYTSMIPLLLPGTAASWDLSAVTDSLPYIERYRLDIPSYDFGDSGRGKLGVYGFPEVSLNSVSAVSISSYGQQMTNAIFDLVTITLGPTDTLFIPSQTQLHSAPCSIISFPCSYGSSWNSVYSTNLSFELSVAMYSLVHEPYTRRRYITRHDTVTGWGQMRVPDMSGSPSPYHDVLQVRSTVYTVDSFFSGSTPMYPPLVTLLSLVQGKKDTSYTAYYYRKAEVTPLATVEYADSNFSTPLRVYTHKQRLIPSAVSSYTKKHISVFPNPMTGRVLSLRNVHATSYVLYSIDGRQVCSGRVPYKEQEVRVHLPENLVPGMYVMQFTAENEPVEKVMLTIE